MLFISIVLLLGLFLGYRNRKVFFPPERYSAINGIIATSFWFFITCAIVSFYLLVVAYVGTHSVGVVDYDKREIVALSGGSSINGSFFLLSGDIKDVPYYFFYYKTEDGGKQLDKVQAHNVTLYEEPLVTPYIVKRGHKYVFGEVSDIQNLLFFPRYFIRWIADWGGMKDFVRIDFIKHHIYVPPGTVKQKMEVDVDKF